MAAVEPVMSVHFNGHTHMVKVKPGEAGRLAFVGDVRRLLRLRDHQEFSIAFECRVPGHGMFLDLKGLSSYDAAVFCAAMTAVERQRLAGQKGKKVSARAQQRLRQAQQQAAATSPRLAAAAAAAAAGPSLVEPLPAGARGAPPGGASSGAAPRSASPQLASPNRSAPTSALLPPLDGGAGPSSDASRDAARTPPWDSACEVGPASGSSAEDDAGRGGGGADGGGGARGASGRGGSAGGGSWLRRKSRVGAGVVAGEAGQAGVGRAARPGAWLRRVLACVQGGGAC